MRVCFLMLGLCAACATPLRDYPKDKLDKLGGEADPAPALIAGYSDYETVHIHQQGTGSEFDLRPSHREFLIALPPGTYEFAAFDEFEPTDERVTFNVRAGEAIYIGSLERQRDTDGNVIVVVADAMPAVEAALVKRYGVNVPELTYEIARSSRSPKRGDYAIRVHRDRTHTRWAWGLTWGLLWTGHYYHYAHHGHHRHGHHRSSGHSGHR